MKTKILLVGGFGKTKHLAKSLLKQGYKVSAINNSQKDCETLANIDKLRVFVGDGTKPFVLADAGVQNMDIAIALTDRDEDNLVICELCKKKFGVKKTVALVQDPKKMEFYRKMGIDSVVCAISTISGIIEQHALLDEMSTLIPIGEGKVNIVQVQITGTSPAVDKKIWELSLPKQVIIGCILRGQENLVPRGDTRLFAGDNLILIASDHHEMEAIRELTGG